MLEYLHIRDLALIEDMELDFGPGINVLTGETGAGKSFILKAIQFLLGEKLGGGMVRPGCEKAQVEALFVLPDGQKLVLRRDLMAQSGRSRFFVNGDLGSQEAIRELRPSLMLHTGQHGQQRLLQPSYQAALVDSFLENPQIIEQKDSLLRELKAVAAERQALLNRVHALQERRDLLEMQQMEIDRVNPAPGEEEQLESMRQELRAYERIQEQYDRGLALLRGEDGCGLMNLAGDMERLLEELGKEDDFFTGARDAIVAFRDTMRELDRRFREVPGPPDPAGLDVEGIETRLFALSQLKRKLHRTMPEILQLKLEVEENLSFLDACGLDINRLKKREQELAARLAETLQLCNSQRRDAAARFCAALIGELTGLGFSERVKVEAELSAHEIWPATGDTPPCMEERVRLLWAPNPGQPSQPLDRIASGGELSRFLLAVTGLQARGGEDATLVFDEVDAGVGGITLNRVAERLEDLASRRQMLLITHWPQLAARAGQHFRVVKEVDGDQTFTRCQRLEGADRETELARMAGHEGQ